MLQGYPNLSMPREVKGNLKRKSLPTFQNTSEPRVFSSSETCSQASATMFVFTERLLFPPSMVAVNWMNQLTTRTALAFRKGTVQAIVPNLLPVLTSGILIL